MICILLLFFILIILILSSTIQFDIKYFEIQNSKIKFNISLQLYILKHIKIFTKKITKKDILKFIDFSDNKRTIRKEKRLGNILDIKIPEINIYIDYGIRHIYTNVYAYGLLNAIIPMIISKYTNTNTKRNYCIKTDFKENKLKLKIKLKANVNIFISIMRLCKNFFMCTQ